MRAVLCKAYGPPEGLVVEDVAPPKPGRGQVVVTVKACGVNFPDTLIIRGLYQFKPPPPFSPGSEVAGIVKEVGAGVETVRPGDRVIAFGAFGGFAEEMLADVDALVPMPAAMDFETAASIVMTYGTNLHALRDRGRLQPGETLLVLGAAGGIGLAAVELGKALGARVIAAASSDEKLAICRQHGADAVINYADEDLKERIQALTARQGVDVIVDPVGGAYSEAALRGWPGMAASWSSGSPRGTSRASRSTSRCSRAARSSACSGAASPPGSRGAIRKTCASCSAGSTRAS